MFIDDDRPTKLKATFTPTNLDLLSVAAMEEYIADLTSEVTRTRTEIEKRNKQRSLAEGLFKK